MGDGSMEQGNVGSSELNEDLCLLGRARSQAAEDKKSSERRC